MNGSDMQSRSTGSLCAAGRLIVHEGALVIVHRLKARVRGGLKGSIAQSGASSGHGTDIV